MQKIKCLFVIFLLNNVFAGDISGIYAVVSGGKESYVEIFKRNDIFYAVGFANKTNEDSGKDVKNPKPELQNRTIRGSVFLWGLRAKNENEYIGGKIYNFSNGMEYYASAKQNGKILKIRASKDSKGVFGKSIEWRKMSDAETAPFIDKRLDVNTLQIPE